jgi:hypothetical protein
VQRIRVADNTLITLVGHNTDGSFVFPDGSSINLGSMHQELGAAGQDPTRHNIAAIISCSSDRYVVGNVVGIPDAVTYRVAALTEQRFYEGIHALAIANSITSVQQLDPQLVREQLGQALQRATSELRTGRTYTYVLYGGGTGTLVVLGIGIHERSV